MMSRREAVVLATVLAGEGLMILLLTGPGGLAGPLTTIAGGILVPGVHDLGLPFGALETL